MDPEQTPSTERTGRGARRTPSNYRGPSPSDLHLHGARRGHAALLPVWAMSRGATADDEIGGYAIPVKALVVVCPYVTHRHPDF